MRLGGASLVLAVAAAAFASPAHAATMTVETEGDEFAKNSGTCALREAVEAARTNKAFGGCPKGSPDRDMIKVPDEVRLSIGAGSGNAGGDLNHDGGGKLTIAGTDTFPVAIVPDLGWTTRAFELTNSAVTLKNLQIGPFDSVEDAGGAIRASEGATLKLVDTYVQENHAEVRGGAIACEGCKRLSITGRFLINNNEVSGADTVQGGAIYTDAPTKISGKSSGIAVPTIEANAAVGGMNNLASGGGIFATDDLTIMNATIGENEADASSAVGGAVTFYPESDEEATLRLSDTTIANNDATSRGGGLEIRAPFGTASLTRVAVNSNHARSAAGIYTSAPLTLRESVVDGNVATAQDASQDVVGAGIYAIRTNAAPPNRLRLSRTSITRNELVGGDAQFGAGVYARSVDVRIDNSTIAANQAPLAGAFGAGLNIGDNGNGGSAAIDFSTFRQNVAGTGTNDGDALVVGVPTTIRASIVDESGDGCRLGTGTAIDSKGFNVEEDPDPDCGLDHPKDTNDPDFLNALGENGSPPVGLPGIPPFDQVTIPRTSVFTNNASGALDLVPPKKCTLGGKPLAEDARGVPRPVGEGCDAGATERVACLGSFVVGSNARIGRDTADNLQGSHSTADMMYAQGGDDQINIYGNEDKVCAGAGDDRILAGENTNSPDGIDGGPGTDFISYNNGGPVTLDLQSQTVVGPNTGTDTLASIENAQGSEGADDIFGSNGPNLLIGGGDPDTILGRGGIDVIDARDGEADIEINCGPGKNTKEKAKIDKGLDPKPISC